MRWSRLAVLLAAAVLLLTRLGATDLWAPDEPRYAQIAEELRSLEHGPKGLVLLHSNAAAYDQKPPLYFWLAALFGIPQGAVSEVAARLPSALSGIVLVWLTSLMGAGLFSERIGAGEQAGLEAGQDDWTDRVGVRVGLWAAALLLTVYRFAHLARRVQLDVLLALLVSLALFAFWRWDTGTGRRGVNLALLHTAMGLAVLTKGPVGLLPIAVIAAYLAWEGRPRQIARLLPAWAWLLSLGPALAWLAGATALGPADFFDRAVSVNLLDRFFAGSSHARPFYYYFYQFPIDFLPWTMLWPSVAMACRHQAGFGLGRKRPESARPWRFLLAWVGVFLLFFSLSAGKRGLYLLPAFPAAALLCGATLERWLRALPALPRSLNCSLGLVAGLVAVAAAVLALGPGKAFEVAPGFALPHAFALGVLGVVIFSSIAWAVACSDRLGPGTRPMRRLAVVCVAVFGLELASFSLLYPRFDLEKSPRPVALAAQQWSTAGSPVGIFEHSALAGGVRYYGGMPVVTLEGIDSARNFLDSGGEVIIARGHNRDRLAAIAALEVRASLRSGTRNLVVLSPSQAPSAR